MKKVSGRLANLTPEQREKLLKKLREQKKEGSKSESSEGGFKNFRVYGDSSVLSFSQQRLWFLEQLEGLGAAYNVPARLEIEGSLNFLALEKSIAFAIEKHEALRSAFVSEQGAPKVNVNAFNGFNLEVEDLTSLAEEQRELKAEAMALELAVRPFSLHEASLFRAKLIRLSDKEHHLIVCMHHIISDAWSMKVLIQDISLAYNLSLKNKALNLENKPRRFIDYSVWQRKQVDEGLFQHQLEYWKEKLVDVKPMNFPYDRERQVEQSYEGGQIVFESASSLRTKLVELARTENLTLFMVLLAAWQLLLAKYSDQDDICSGTPVANRPYRELEESIGFFVNTLPVRSKIKPEASFIEYLQDVKRSAVGVYANADVPFERILNELGVERDLSETPVFQNMFSFQNESVADAISFEGLKVKLEPIHTRTAKFDLSLDVVDQQNKIKFSIEYNAELFSQQSIEALRQNFISLLENIVLKPSEKTYLISCVNEHDVEKQLNTLKVESKVFFSQESLLTRFKKTVNKKPNKFAINEDGIRLNYKQLDMASSQLAQLMQSSEKSNSCIALATASSVERLVFMLACIKTNTCYALLDSLEQIQAIEKLNPDLILVSEDFPKRQLEALSVHELQIVNFDFVHKPEETRHQLVNDINQEQLLYRLAHNSGKGVEWVSASHANLQNAAAVYIKELEESEQDLRCCLSHTENSVSEQALIFASLISGAELVFCKNDAQALVDKISKHEVQIASFTPRSFYELIEQQVSFQKLASLRLVFLHGESIKPRKLTTWFEQSETRLFNVYSISRCAGALALRELGKNELLQERLASSDISSIGSLFTSPTIILNQHKQLVPTGSYGQLYLECLWPLENINKDVVELSLAGKHRKFYATGDTARLLPSGEIQLLASSGENFWIKNHRFNQQRVIHALLGFEGIKDAELGVCTDNDRNECLVAFLQLEQEEHIKFDVDEIKDFLRKSLPDYLIPENIHVLSNFPKTLDDKLDRSALNDFVKAFQDNREFWVARLQSYETLQLPLDYLKPEPLRDIRSVELCLEQKLLSQLTLICEQEKISTSVLCLGLMLVLLKRYSAQSNFAIARRVQHFAFPWLKGKQDNILVQGLGDAENLTFRKMLSQLATDWQEVDKHGNVIIETILESDAQLIEDKAGIFEVAFDDSSEKNGNEVKDFARNFSLTLNVGSLTLTNSAHFYFDAFRFKTETIEQLARHYKQLAEALLFDTDIPLDEVDYLSEIEKQSILALSQGEQVTYPAYPTVSHFLDDTREQHKESAALEYFEDGKVITLTYDELHQASDQLAVYLQAQGLDEKKVVALCLERSPDMVISLLAVLKTGSPYLPLDPELPQDRLDFMIQDSGAQFVLCQAETAKRFKRLKGVINLSELSPAQLQESVQKRANNFSTGEDLFNIIYTSGSTGMPKGVMVTHQGILNRIQWMQSEYQLAASDKVLQKTTYSFDVSVWEFIWPLSQGACLVLAKADGHKDPAYLSDIMKRAQISHCHFVPSMLLSWLDYGADGDIPLLNKVFCSGEALSREAVNRFYQLFPDSELHNLYGPTEASIDVSYWHCSSTFDAYASVPIGRPVSNTQLYVLDEKGAMVPFGVPGELHIGGIQLARGYLNREELSKTTFIEKELPKLGRQKMYRTGDLVKQRADGVIEYLGRIDDQVKIRGYRIELGEIETRLHEMPGVNLCVVTASNLGSSKKLLAYVSLDETMRTQYRQKKEELQKIFKQHLAAHLPEYMVPHLIIFLDEMPTLNNGKINRKLLPKVDFSLSQSNEFISAESENERMLQEIWQSVLGLESISVRDNFFDLGGDSILSIQIISAARQKNIILNPSQIFRYPTIAQLAQVANTNRKVQMADQGLVYGEFECSPVQQWFFSNSYEEGGETYANHFNQSLLLNLEKGLSEDLLHILISILLEKHDALNLKFYQDSAGWHQQHSELNHENIYISSLSSIGEVQQQVEQAHPFSLASNLKAAQESLDIREGRVVHFRLLNQLIAGEIKQSLYIVAHHLVIDGISWRVILDDLNTLLKKFHQQELIVSTNESLKQKLSEELPEKTISYKQWVKGLRELASSELVIKDQQYWLGQLEDFQNHKSLLGDMHKTSSLYEKQKRKSFSLNTTHTEKFLKKANKSYRTDANELLLCALLNALVVDSKEKKLLLTMETHGRELSETWSQHLNYPDVSRTLGWFTQMYPVLLSQKLQSRDWGDNLQWIKEQLRAVPNKGAGFALLNFSQEKHISNRLKSHKADFSFNYLGQFGDELSSESFRVDTDLRLLAGADALDQAGALKRAHALDIVAFVSANSLQCDFLYDCEKFSEKQIDAYLEDFKHDLIELIEHCCEQTHSYLSPSDLIAANLKQSDINLIEAQFYSNQEVLGDDVQSRVAHNIETMHGLLPTQSGMLFHNIFSKQQHEHSYLEQFCVELKGDLNTSALEDAWKQVIDAYANLRSAFSWQLVDPVQIVFKQLSFSLREVDFSQQAEAYSENSYKQTLKNFLEKDREEGFDLSKPPLMRVSLLKMNRDTHWMIWTHHHILLDGWSVPLVLNKLFENYLYLLEGKNIKALSNSQQLSSFEEYIAWHQKQFFDEIFWKTELSGFSDVNEIELEPLAQPIETSALSEDNFVYHELSIEKSEELRQLAKNHQLTLNSVLQGAWAILLSHYSGDDDVVFGVTVSGRSAEFSDVENIVGMFINTLPMRINFSKDLSLRECLLLLQEKQQLINQHQHSALSGIQKLVGLEAEVSLFNSIFVFENFPVSERLKKHDARLGIGDFHSFEKTNYPLAISVEPGESIKLRVLFDQQRYRKNTIERLLAHMQQLLMNFSEYIEASVFDIPYITNAEKDALKEWNRSGTSYPEDENLAALFVKKAAQYPDNIALKFDDACLSYKELDQQSNQLTKLLNEKGVVSGQRIILFMDRSPEFLVSLLAVVKVGAVYVPIDPAYPEERIQYMLHDSEPSYIISLKQHENMLSATLAASENLHQLQSCISYFDERKEWQQFSQQDSQFYQSVSADDLLYIMYTSGSTGQPKGVCIHHRAVTRLVINTWYTSIGPKDRIGHISNVCFDASVYEIWGALLNGASLIGFDRETILSEELFAHKLQSESVSNMFMTALLFQAYSRDDPAIFSKMRTLLVGGEPVPPSAALRVIKHNPAIHLMNGYGPTENTVFTASFDILNLSENAKNVPVGKPISNTTIYILDARGQEVPVGVVGELVCGGDGVGLGYWRKDDITQKVFIKDSFSQKENARLYRTGDLARRLPDGNVEVIGRMDDQIKIRGFRIEPGEISKKLNSLHGVENGVVVAIEMETGKKYLIAYYVFDKKVELDLRDIKAALSESLPAHMIPSFFIEVKAIPLTANGKLDKARLPKPKIEELFRENYVAPRTETEKTLANVWSDVLKISSVGVFDNFFELGGDSIISIQIVSRAKRLGLEMTPRLLFEHPTIAELSDELGESFSHVVAEQGLVNGEVRLNPVQRWFFEQEFKDNNHFNQSLLFKINESLTLQSFTPVISALLRRHDVLRLRFNSLKGEWIQKHDNANRSLSSLVDILSEQNLSKTKDAYQAMSKHSQEVQRQLSISDGPLLKVVLYHLGAQGQRLLIVVHHLIIDGVSWRILLDDLNLAFEQQFSNQAIDLGKKGTSFQHYSMVLEDYANSEAINADREYWRNTLPDIRNIELIKKTEVDKTFRVKQKRFELPSAESALLLGESNRAYRTETQDLLLLAFALSLKENNLCEQICIELEGHGRDCLSGELARQVELSSTVGWFTSMYPAYLPLTQEALDSKQYDVLIKEIKSYLRAIPGRGSSFFLLKYLSKDKQFLEQVKLMPKAEVSFNYLGQMQEAEDEGVLAFDSSYLNLDASEIQDNSENNAPTHHLTLNSAYREGKFIFNFNFNASVVSGEQIDALQISMMKHLTAIISWCQQSKHFGFTPSDLPYLTIEQTQLDDICHSFIDSHEASNEERASTAIAAIYPLSPMQEGMLFHSRLDDASGMYCEQVSVLFSGFFDVAAMEKSWNDAMQAHDILRTSFIWEKISKPLQVVQSHSSVKIQLMDWRNEMQVEEKLKNFLIEDRATGFDFSQAPLMRLYYIRWPSSNPSIEKGRFVWSYHHILLDGWSMPLLMKEIFERYNQQRKQKKETLTFANSEGKYQNYIDWLYKRAHQEELLKARGEIAQSEQFWHTYLAGFEEPTTLGINKLSISRSMETQSMPELRFLESHCSLDREQTQRLHQFASSHQVTVNTLFQAAWALLLNRYSGEQDIVYGITVSGRPSELNHIESIIGLFINTVPFRVRVDAETRLDQWLKNIFRNQIELRQFETTPLVDIQAQSQIDGSRALFDSILVFENYPLDETVENAPEGLKIDELQVYEQTNFPLSLIILPGEELDIRILFDSYSFEGKAIDKVLIHLRNILLELMNVEDSYQRELQAIDYLSDEERQTIIQDWNDTDTEYPRDSYLHEIVSQHSSSNLALISEAGQLSYQELETRANQLSNYMRYEVQEENRIQAGDKVVVCLNRSNELIISILAILKAGGVYVPLDPGYPEERQRYMLEDTQTRLIVTDSDNAPLVKHLCANKSLRNSIHYIDIKKVSAELESMPKKLEHVLPPYSDNEDIPVAILYTSGSTGQPKGVCLTHRGLSRMVMNTNYMQLKEDDRVAHVSNICFDAASFEIWAALLNGLPLVILEKDIMLDLYKFEQALKNEGVTILLITTALFNLVAKERVSALEKIRYLFFGGEACNAGMVRRVLYEAKPEHLMHMYGPSENSTYATWYEVKEVAADAKTIPIGRAVSNSQVYIMNQQGDLLPPGVAGEIVCAGDGLALGYLNKPEQTQKAFVNRKLPNRDWERMYLTGDLGVCLPDGSIEILGRIDNQVKIRGHRIEPEEIIARINSLTKIKKAHVLVKQDKEDKKYLVAYYVPEEEWKTTQDDRTSRSRELKIDLKNLMPDYMVPSFYVEIEDLPLTPNGKIDTKALPDADILQTASEYIAPEGELEEQIVKIWQEVLQQKRIGVLDDFFELGGHSLLATQIHSRIRQQLGIDIPLRTLFELPTIREFSEFWLAISQNQISHDDDSDEFEEGEL